MVIATLYPSAPAHVAVTTFPIESGQCGDPGPVWIDRRFNATLIRAKRIDDMCKPELVRVLNPSFTIPLWRGSGDRYVPLADAEARVTASAGDRWIIVSRGSYLIVSPQGIRRRAPFNAGFKASAVVSDVDGNVFTLEEKENDPSSPRIIAFSNGQTIRSRLSSRFSLARAASGAAYLIETRAGQVDAARLGEHGASVQRYKVAPKLRISPDDVALTRDGNLWMPGLLGVVEIDQSGRVIRSVENLTPEPKSISNPYPLSAHELVVGSDEALWFRLMGKLWRLAPNGDVTYLENAPESFGHVAPGPKGAIWISDSRGLTLIRPLP